MYLLSFKIAPAIAAGCTVVCKPSEMTSLTAHMLAKVMNEAGKDFKDIALKDWVSCVVAHTEKLE